jgi:hypothetical protein
LFWLKGGEKGQNKVPSRPLFTGRLGVANSLPWSKQSCPSYFPFGVEIKSYQEQFEQLRRQIREVVCLSCRKRVRPTLHAVDERYCGAKPIRVQRVKCRHCAKTFRVLPEFVVPYKPAGVAEVEPVLLAWRQRGSYRGVARALELCVHAVKRWVGWWRVVEAVTEAQRGQPWDYAAGWLGQLLEEFRHWRGCWLCERIHA